MAFTFSATIYSTMCRKIKVSFCVLQALFSCFCCLLACLLRHSESVLCYCFVVDSFMYLMLVFLIVHVSPLPQYLVNFSPWHCIHMSKSINKEKVPCVKIMIKLMNIYDQIFFTWNSSDLERKLKQISPDVCKWYKTVMSNGWYPYKYVNIKVWSWKVCFCRALLDFNTNIHFLWNKIESIECSESISTSVISLITRYKINRKKRVCLILKWM